MNNETKLTAQELALYLGCEASALPNNGIGIFRGIDVSGWAEIEIPEIGLFTTNYFSLLLRPLSDMTEDEARDVYYIRNGEVFNPRPEYWPENHADISALDDLRSDVELYQEDIRFVIGEPAAWHYLLAHHFDLFGWIESGLAIDKTKIETK